MLRWRARRSARRRAPLSAGPSAAPLSLERRRQRSPYSCHWPLDWASPPGKRIGPRSRTRQRAPRRVARGGGPLQPDAPVPHGDRRSRRTAGHRQEHDRQQRSARAARVSRSAPAGGPDRADAGGPVRRARRCTGADTLLEGFVAEATAKADPAALADARQKLANIELLRGHADSSRPTCWIRPMRSGRASSRPYMEERLEGLVVRARLQRARGDLDGAIATTREAITAAHRAVRPRSPRDRHSV